MSVERPRRFYLLKRLAAHRVTQHELEGMWAAKQLAEPGVELDADFPFRERLVSAGYLTVEDVQGANTEELQQAGLTPREAAAVLAAL